MIVEGALVQKSQKPEERKVKAIIYKNRLIRENVSGWRRTRRIKRAFNHHMIVTPEPV